MSVSFKDKPDHIERELNSLRSHGIATEVVERKEHPHRVVFECIIPENVFGNNTGESIDLEIIFPDNFPFFRPQVHAKKLNLPRHQNPVSFDLCLLGRETVNWDIQSIGTFLQERLPKVLKEGIETDSSVIAKIPNEQAEPVSEYYTSMKSLVFTSGRPIIMDEPITFISSELKILDSGRLKIETKQNPSKVELIKNSNSGLVININKWLDKKGNLIETDFESYFPGDKSKTITWYKLSKFPSEIYGENFLNLFKDLIMQDNASELQKLELRTHDFKLFSSFAILFPEEYSPGMFGWGWMQFTLGEPINRSSKGRRNPDWQIMGSKIQRLSKTEYFKRIPQVKRFQEKTVGLVGLGAIGAPIAIELAKNGIKTLKILDYDWVEVSNSVRWPLGLDYIGYLKTEALKKYISTNYPHTTILPFDHRIGNPYSKIDENELLKQLFVECDVVIDATVENAVNHLLSNRCRSLGIPYILAEGRRGGWGGIIAKILPEPNKGCWTCLQHKLYNEEDHESIPRPPDDHSGDVQQAGCGDISFTGTHFDLVNVSLAVVKVIANIFSSDETFDWDVAVLRTVNKDDDKPILPQWETFNLSVSKHCSYQDDFHS